MHTPNLADENYKKLAELFPNAVTESVDEEGNVVRAIDKDVLMQEISTEVVEGNQERYQFTWPDKNQSILLANAPIEKTLRLNRIKSVGHDGTKGNIDTENIYIEGDNLDALKLLQETYLGKVKMIYIDPPYNTGSDFIYEDDFSQNVNKYKENSGEYDEQGNQMFQNTDSNGRFHTDWLNMIYPRLRLAKDLLSQDGSIFVSIDYNETENLKKIMNEIFGAENFQREIVWRIGWLSGYKTTAPNFIRNHDTILFYSKNHNHVDFIKKYIPNADFKPLIKKEKKLTKKLEYLGLTDTQQKELLQFINHDNRPERYPIEDTWNSNEYDDLNSIAIVSFSGEKISKILNINQDFKGQKSIKMLSRLIESTTRSGDIIMDFFSGTASTAHAIMQLNAEELEDRKYVMIQLPEKTNEDSEANKAGLKTICDIGEERIRLAGAKIREVNNSDIDYGFRVFSVDSSNMQDTFYKPSEFGQLKLNELIDNIKPDRSPEDLLFQVMLDLGILLSSKIEEVIIDEKKVYSVENGYLIACFDKNISNDTIIKIAKYHPVYAVFRDIGMQDDNVMTNFDQIFETYSSKTERKVL